MKRVKVNRRQRAKMAAKYAAYAPSHMSDDATRFSTRIKSWEDIGHLIQHFSFYSAHDWLFRGVTDATHPLVAKIGRETTRANKRASISSPFKRIPYSLADERAIFSMFRSQALAYIDRAPATHLEWLAIAQHFGMPTRLLDWTASFLVAAWFAVEKAGDKKGKVDAAIWVTNGVKSIDAEDKRDPLALTTPCIYRPAHVSPRIPAQASVLMLCPKPTEEVKLPFLQKITIERDAEFTIKKRLNACGVNKRLLFPDLQGLAEHLGWLHKHNYLAGYTTDMEKMRGTPDEEDEDRGQGKDAGVAH